MEELVLDWPKFKSLIAKIARDISLDSWRPDCIVGITRGGLLPATMLSHYFNVPMYTVKISLRDDNDCESNGWLAEEAFGYIFADNIPRNPEDPVSNPALRKNILIVDDINDSGATINWLVDDWQSTCIPNSLEWVNIWGENVRFATVVENTASKSYVKTNYTGLEINKAEQDVWVSFPYENWWE